MNTVLFSSEDGVATITLNRPEARNALNLEMCEALIDVSRKASSDQEIKLVLVRARGPSFCAGADLKEREGMNELQVRNRRMKAFEAYAALEALPMPAIAVVEGPCVGSGCEIAAACDFIVATPAA
ncbi:MAG TPA: enoyl-CoA hydratase/isomerase family protein, partial [Burkholderiales bacterium]|nr:enoyl-CoA hydratase/isomerase family protein [Burkholderiales bacterium]